MRRRIEIPTDAEDAKINRGIALDSDSPELTERFLANARTAAEMMPSEVYAALVATRHHRPGDQSPKTKLTRKER